MKKSELKSLIKMIVTESHDWYLGEESTHEVKSGDRVRLINKGGYNNYQGTVTKVQMHGNSGPWADIKWDMPHHPCTTPMETKHLEVVMNEGEHPLPQDTHATDLNELAKNNLQENKTIMKKSELKSLLKVIIQEVVAAKQKRIDETKGLSGFKKSKDSTDHTENVASSKDLTGKGPTEKSESKKLPVVKKPATPKVGIKEEIMAMIRESIEEMARVAGAVGSKFKVQDASSPTGWSVKGHKSIPDGTPTDAPKGPYVPKGIAGMGRPKKSAAGSTSSDGEQAAGATLNVTFDGDALQFDFLNSTWPQSKKFIESEIMSQLGDAALDPNVKVGQSVYNKIEAAKEMDIEGKLNASNNRIDLTFDAASKQLVAK
jgi:hypothetical protein